MLTCLDLAWAAVGPFFLNTVTVSQSLSAMFQGVHSIPVMFNNRQKNRLQLRVSKMIPLKRVSQCYFVVSDAPSRSIIHAFCQSFIENTVVISNRGEEPQQRPLLLLEQKDLTYIHMDSFHNPCGCSVKTNITSD